MKYIKINDLEDLTFSNIQGWKTKLEFSKNFYNTFNEDFTDEEKELLDEECMNVLLNNSISYSELEFQKNRYENGFEKRNYKEVSIMFSVNKVFERLILIFINREQKINLEINKNSFNHTNFIYSRESDFIQYDLENDNDIYYDLEGRTFETSDDQTVIQFLDNKVNNNFKLYTTRNKQLYVIQYYIRGSKFLQLSIIDINELYKNNLFYRSNEHTRSGNKIYRINKEISFETYLINNENKITHIQKGNNIMTRSEFNQFEYRDIKNYILENVRIEDVLEHFNFDIPNYNHFNCIFHEDTTPSASISYNKYVCWAGCLNDFVGTTYLNVIELYAKLTHKDLKSEIWDIMYDLYNLSNLDVSNINISKKKNNNQEKYNKNMYEKKQKYILTKDRIHNHLSESETQNERKYCSQYLQARGIENEELLMNILNLNGCQIAQKFSKDENFFYFDFGNKTCNKETILYRRIDKYINLKKYEEHIKYCEENGIPYIEKGVVGFNDYHILKTDNKEYYRDENGRKHMKEIVIFEGFFDCFSFIELSNNIKKYTLVILNSISNVDKLLKDIENSLNEEENSNSDLFSNIYKVYTDNDKAGRESFEKIKEKILDIDEDIIIEDFDYDRYMNKQVKDLNEYCIELKKLMKEQKKGA